MRKKSAPPDRVVAEIAARQYGVIRARQLDAAGIRGGGLARRIRMGRLHRIHRGVYAVGHSALSQEGMWMAAVFAFGEGAVLSHLSAASLWRLLPTGSGQVDVTVAGRTGRRKRTGIRLHRPRSLTVAQVTRRRRIPVTTPVRTIADLRRVVNPSQLRRAVREAEVLGLDIGIDVEADRTRSELEDRFLRLCRRHRLSAPEVNTRIRPFTVDFLWRESTLIVETDGYQFHRGRQAFEDDRARDTELKLLGYEVVRFTHRQVLDDPATVAAGLRALLSRG